MKKLLLPLFATMALVSQAWAGICTGDGGATACQFEAGCYEMSSEYSGTSTCKGSSETGSLPNCTCDQIIANCKTNGALYSGVTGWAATNDYGKGWKCSEHGGTYQGGKLDPSKTVLGCCKWSTEASCYPIYSGLDTDGEDGDDKVKSCKTGLNTFWSGSGACPTTCPTSTPTYNGAGKTVLGCCKWSTQTNCYPILDELNDEGKTGAEQVQNCKSGSNLFWNGECPGEGICPSTPPVNGGTSSAGNSSNPSSSSGGSGSPSSSSTPSSSSAVLIKTNGYAIFPFDISNTTTEDKGAESKSVWGTDASAYVFPTEGDNHASFQNPTNPHYTDGKLAVDQGVLKLKGVNLGTSPGTNDYYPGAFLQIKAGAKDGKSIEDCTSGFSYWYKGDAHWFILEFDPSVCGSATSDGSNKWGKKITPAASINWKQVTLALSDLPLANTWDGANCNASNAKDVKLNKVTQMSWGFDDKQTGTNLMIGDIVCLGSGTYETRAPDNSITTSTGYFGGSTPIISHNTAPVSGLNVTHFARNLQIATGKNATVSMFDIRGKQVFSQKVLSGTTSISLANQKQGIYYVIAKSDSQKQIVKIIVK